METHRKRRRGFDGDVQDAIEGLAEEGWSPAQIGRHLRRDGAPFKGRVPTNKTIQRVVKAKLDGDDSAPWRIDKAAEVAPVAAFDVLADVIVRTEGRIASLTVGEAQWITTLRTLRDDLPLWAAYRLARLYLRRHAAQQPTDDLDAFLTCAPWRSVEQAQAHQRAVDGGFIGPPPSFLAQLINPEWLDHQTINASYRAIPAENRKVMAQAAKEVLARLHQEGQGDAS